MTKQTMPKKYVIFSVCLHVILLAALILSADFTSPLAVIENTNKHDVISAVILGDTVKSKILPQKIAAPPPPPQASAEKPDVKPAPMKAVEKQDDAIALQAEEKKKIAKLKALEEKKRKDLFAKELLADIKKQKEAQKKLKQKKLTAAFEKTLKEHAEKSLRQQFLNEDIKLKGIELRQSQGQINKYKALISQAISEHWIVPSAANKKLSCLLMIRLAPGGTVLDVQITKGSGDPALDSSARAAVLKASPLPVPKTPGEFEPFRQFVLTVRPENILTGELS